MSTKQNLCRYVIFSQNCCFVANFVDKGLVNDNTRLRLIHIQGAKNVGFDTLGMV